MIRRAESPDELLAAARHLLETPDARTVGVWARAVAYLSRQALEAYLNALWSRRAPGTELVSARAQLICLPCYLGNDELARRITYTWNGLSHACHHHSYELAPTAAELRDWLRVIGELAELPFPAE
jgi:hypothetical protein